MVAVMRVCGMRTGITVDVKGADRARLEVIVADRNSPQKHVWRARIVLLTADGLGTNEIMRQTVKSKTCLWRWQERFIQTGVWPVETVSFLAGQHVYGSSALSDNERCWFGKSDVDAFWYSR